MDDVAPARRTRAGRTSKLVLLRARTVLPVSRPPFEDGGVLVEGNRVIAVRQWRRFTSAERAATVDLGDVILLPGLINAHCHLDYTSMAGLLPARRDFAGWIQSITALKAQWGYTDFAQSWLEGAQMLLRNGTTTVMDIEAVPELLPEVWTSTPLRVHSLIELIGFRPASSPRTLVDEAMALIESLPAGRCGAGLSPHAPYTTTREVLSRAATAARRTHRLLAVHVSESAEEFEMFRHARGPMFEWLEAQRDCSDCGALTPIQHLERCGVLGARTLAIHANHLAPGDADLLARRGAHVVHCPTSHAYFRHEEFQLERLLRAGVNVCLGTDSLASTQKPRGRPLELDLHAEMRLLAAERPGLAPAELIRMATRNGAAALGLAGRLGELTPGARADLIAVPHTGSLATAPDAVIHSESPVLASLIDGEWAIEPPR